MYLNSFKKIIYITRFNAASGLIPKLTKFKGVDKRQMSSKRQQQQQDCVSPNTVVTFHALATTRRMRKDGATAVGAQRQKCSH